MPEISSLYGINNTIEFVNIGKVKYMTGDVWEVRDGGALIGVLNNYNTPPKYYFDIDGGMFFESTELRLIADKIDELNSRGTND